MIDRVRDIIQNNVPPLSDVQRMVEVEINVAMRHLRAFNRQLQGKPINDRNLQDIDATSIGLILVIGTAIAMLCLVTTIVAFQTLNKYAAAGK